MNVWEDTQGASDKRYIVETSVKPIQRCILMTTDPGYLILDPTCGAGTTANVAEQWGRRWITIDTSRVALALARAWATFLKLELQPPHAYAAIILDCDSDSIQNLETPGKAWWGSTPTPTPSWMVINTRPRSATRRAGGIHCVYALEIPVGRTDSAHTLPLTYLAHIADRLSYHLGADPGYTGLITRNPIDPGPDCFTHWGRMFPYTLRELDKALPKGKPPSRRLTIIGRNCDLFKSMVSEVFRPRWADTLGAQGWSEAWLDHVRAQNNAMFAPDVLPDTECQSIAKSCFRYWTRHYDPERFSDIQRSRMGKRWHGNYAYDFDHQAEDVRQLKSWGLKQVTIGAVVGLSQARVSQMLSQGL